MKFKNITALAALFFCISGAVAQPIDVRRFEGEFGVGGVTALNPLVLDHCNLGVKVFGEVRYNIKQLPMDAGLHLAWTTMGRKAAIIEQPLKSNSWNVMAVTDYNFMRGRTISIFLGAGVGLGYMNMTMPVKISASDIQARYITGDDALRLCAMPRVGFEFFNHLRLTVSYTVQEVANNHLSVAISGVLGGGPKFGNDGKFRKVQPKEPKRNDSKTAKKNTTKKQEAAKNGKK